MSKQTILPGILGLLLFTTMALGVHAATFPDDAPDGVFEFTAVQSGNWQNPNTWGGSSIPTQGSDVRIPASLTVTVKRQEANAIRYLKVEGEFRLWVNGDSRLKVETIFVADTGTLRIGTSGSRVHEDFTAEVVFTSSGAIDTAWDPKQASRGLVSDGSIRLFGAVKTHMVKTSSSSEALAGDTAVDLDLLPSDWNMGDEVVLAGTHFDRYAAVTSSQDEVRVISTFPGNAIGFSTPLAYDHRRASAEMNLHVANLTRNIIFRSESTTPVSDRGHVMLRNGDVIIENAAFIGLGRTDKSVPLDDVDVVQHVVNNGKDILKRYEVTDPKTPPTNRRGRYSLHFHENSVTTDPSGQTFPPALPSISTVYGSVVRDAIGWGFVNHSSNVDFQRNVAYDFVGAGFVTELGNEVGKFIDNIAIRGRGDGDFDPIHQFVFANDSRRQPLSDFAFRGHGFWFQGPALTVRDNVASGCDGAGMVWFTPGAPIHNSFYMGADGFQKNRYSHFPRDWVDEVYGGGTENNINPRFWLRPDEEDGDSDPSNDDDSRVVIADLPILEMDGFEAYGNYVGFRLRFNNSGSNPWYNDTWYHYTEVIRTAGSVDRATQEVKNLKLWNNQQAFRMRYVQDTDWSNIKAINRLAYDSPAEPFAGHDGAEIYHSLKNQEFIDTLVIEGYPVAGRIDAGNRDAEDDITFNGQQYDKFAQFDTWNSSTTCPVPTYVGTPNVRPTQTFLHWVSSSPNHLVRYRQVGEQLWTYLGPVTHPPVLIQNLTSGTSYEFQVLAGCQVGDHETLSAWSATTGCTTP